MATIAQISWPSELPSQPIFTGGYKEGYAENVNVSSQVAAGKPLVRPRASAFYKPFTIPLVVKTDALKDRFDDFYYFDTAVGSLPFNWPGWVRRGSSVFVFDPSGKVESESMGNGVWQITFTLLQFPDGA